LSPRPSWSASFSQRFDFEFRQAAARWLPGGPDWKWTKAQGVQESGLDPAAVSPVGARGVMQVMPGTWGEIQKAMGWRNVSPHSAHHNIFGGVYYQARMAKVWAGRGRSIAEAYDLGLAGYNAGTGTILQAQGKCNDARLWAEISPCLVQVSGAAHAKETTGYVRNIARWRAMMPDRVEHRCAWSGHRGGCGPNR
jgi:soluble lytic murein transglycosylase-like protein